MKRIITTSLLLLVTICVFSQVKVFKNHYWGESINNFKNNKLYQVCNNTSQVKYKENATFGGQPGVVKYRFVYGQLSEITIDISELSTCRDVGKAIVKKYSFKTYGTREDNGNQDYINPHTNMMTGLFFIRLSSKKKMKSNISSDI